MKNFTLDFVVLLSSLTIELSAQSNVLDSSFQGGTVTTRFSTDDEHGRAVTVQSDGKILVAGEVSFNGAYADFALARYNTNGTLDINFNDCGKITAAIGESDDIANTIILQPDGKILLAGCAYAGSKFDFALARFNPDGSLDKNFNTTGKVITNIGTGDAVAKAIVLQPDGKILVAGYATINFHKSFTVIRYLQDGNPDISFGSGGISVLSSFDGNSEINTLTLQDDGKIIVGGYCENHTISTIALARLNKSGNPDPDFGKNGIMTTFAGNGNSSANAMVLQPGGKIIVAGESYLDSNHNLVLLRYNKNGSVDQTFNKGAKVSMQNLSPQAVFIEADGKILVGGNSFSSAKTDFALAQFDSSGDAEFDFGLEGKIIKSFGRRNDIVTAAAMQPDGKVILAGYSANGANDDFALARFFTTPAACNTCLPPTEMNATDITCSSAFLRWTNSQCTNTCKLEYRKKGDNEWISLNVNSPFKSLDRLVENTSYEWKMRSDCGDQKYGAETDVETFTTTGNDELNALKLFPNPACNQLQIESPDFDGEIQLDIFNVFGKNVKNVNTRSDNQQVTTLDISDLVPGTYQIIIRDINQAIAGKFVKQ